MPMQGFIYLIRMGETPYYKVGISTTDPLERLAYLQVSSPYDLAIVETFYVKNPTAVERQIHRALAHCHVRGEWFDNTSGDVAKVFHDYGAMALVDTIMDSPVLVTLPKIDTSTGTVHCAKCKRDVAWATPSEAGTIRRWGCGPCRARKSGEA